MDLVFDSDPAEVPPGETTTFTCRPGRRCRGVQLRMHPQVADNFLIEDIRVGFFSELTTGRDVLTGPWFLDGDEACLAIVLSVCEAHEDFALSSATSISTADRCGFARPSARDRPSATSPPRRGADPMLASAQQDLEDAVHELDDLLREQGDALPADLRVRLERSRAFIVSACDKLGFKALLARVVKLIPLAAALTRSQSRGGASVRSRALTSSRLLRDRT